MIQILLLASLLIVEGVSAFQPVLPNAHTLPQHRLKRPQTTTLQELQASIASAAAAATSSITEDDLHELSKNHYCIIPNFLSDDLQESLRRDVNQLREEGHFKIAKIGQDSTNMLNQQIRVAETCFIGGPRDIPDNNARTQMTSLLQSVCARLSQNEILKSPKLDQNLSELLYAYYPQGGFYRRHRDAIAGSASVLRTYSLLLYLNGDWKETDGGHLRMHMDSGGDELPVGEEPNYLDVAPTGGTLVIFDSEKIPHEVLDTNAERLAIVGWYNRELSASDIKELGVDPVRLGMMAVSVGLVTAGLVSIIS